MICLKSAHTVGPVEQGVRRNYSESCDSLCHAKCLEVSPFSEIKIQINRKKCSRLTTNFIYSFHTGFSLTSCDLLVVTNAAKAHLELFSNVTSLTNSVLKQPLDMFIDRFLDQPLCSLDLTSLIRLYIISDHENEMHFCIIRLHSRNYIICLNKHVRFFLFELK